MGKREREGNYRAILTPPPLFFPAKKGRIGQIRRIFCFPPLKGILFFFLRAYATLPLFPSRRAAPAKKGEKTEVVFGVYFFAGNGRMSPQQTRFCALDRKSLPLSKFGKCFFEAPKKCQFSAKELVQSSYTISRNIFYSYSVLLFPSRRPNLECMGGWYMAA